MPAARHSTRDRVIASVVVAAQVLVTALVMGPAAVGLCLAWLAGFAIWLLREPATRPLPRDLLFVYVAAIVIQAAHVGEEIVTGFPAQFPALVGDHWSLLRFVAFNVAWLLAFAWGASTLKRGSSIGMLLAWQMAIGPGAANGVGHLALSAWLGRAFPGVFTAPFCVTAGLALLQQLTNATSTKTAPRVRPAPNRARTTALALEVILFTIVVPGTVTYWLPEGLGLFEPNPHVVAWLRAGAVVPLAIGTAVYVRCVWEFAARGRGIPAPVDHPKQLVVSGLYRYMRNPMYVGVFLILLGELLFVQSAALLVYASIAVLFIHVNILLYEEPNLRYKFGSAYDAYTATVSRWLPARPAAASKRHA